VYEKEEEEQGERSSTNAFLSSFSSLLIATRACMCVCVCVCVCVWVLRGVVSVFNLFGGRKEGEKKRKKQGHDDVQKTQ
jgi:hypothetical protein